MNSWLYLIGAIILEVSGTTAMKASDGFARPMPSFLMAVFYACSFTCLTLAIKRIDISVGYAVWSGVGTVLVAVIGLLWFREPFTMLKGVGLLMVAFGVAAVHLGAQPS